MPSKPIAIPAPIKGLSDDTAWSKQPPLTTRDSLNCRAIESRTGRQRMAPRSGLGLYISPDAQINGTNIVQDIIAVSKNEDLLTYAVDTTPDTVFAKKLPGARGVTAGSEQQGDGVDMKMDAFGDLYVAQRVSGVFKYNQDGELLQEILVPEAESGGRVEIIACDVDEFGNVAVAMGGGGSSATDCRLHFFEVQLDGTYRRAWSLDTGNCFFDVAFFEGDIYTLEGDDMPVNFSGGGETSWLRLYRDYNTTEAPTEDEDVRFDVTTACATNVFGTRMAIRDDGVVYIAACNSSTTATTVRCYTLKVNPNGDTPQTEVWVIDGDSGANDIGGIGYDVRVGPKNSVGQYTIYTYGPQGTATAQRNIRRIVDTGTSFNASGTDSWDDGGTETQPGANPQTMKFVRMATDKDGYVYCCPPTVVGDEVIAYKDDGTALQAINYSGDTWVKKGGGVAVSQEDKPKGSTADEVEHVFWCVRETVSNQYAFFKHTMLTVTQGSGTMRSLVQLAVSNGDIVKFTTSSASAPTGGSGALDTSAPHVMSAALGERVFYTDGKSYKYYSVEDDEVFDWVSKTSENIPPRCRIIETWRGRLVLGRDPEDPQLWHMSAVGDPFDWDNFPSVPVVTQAISGINAKAGKVPDIVNAIIPWDDDLCLFGGDRSIWRLTGDPLAGGQFDLISDETGIAFGRSWTKDPIGGRLFFAGSRGGIYMMERNSLPVRISRDSIERRLQDQVDFSTYYLRLVWNYRDEGLHVFQCPFAGNEGTIVKHWFWDSKNGGWWEDQFGSTAEGTELQPCAVYVVDGDAASDRKLLIGGEDGRIRVWDEDQVDDAVTTSSEYPVRWKLVYGPLLPSNLDSEFRFRRFTAVLARDQGGCAYRFYAPDEADVLGKVLHTGSLGPGRNNGSPARFRGANAYLQLSNATEGSRCSVEDLLIHAARAGRVRVRE